MKKEQKKSIKPRTCFFERLNKIGKPLARLTKKKRDITHIKKIRNERGEITDSTEIQKQKQKNIKEYCQQIDQPRRNGQVSRNIQPTKTESRINT